MGGSVWSVRRVLALAFAVLVIQVFLFESSTHLNHVAPLVPPSESFDGSLASLAANTSSRRYSDLIELADSFEGSRVFVSEVPPEQRWSRSLLGGIGRVSAVGTGIEVARALTVQSAPVEFSGTSRRGEWTILAVDLGARDFAYVSMSETEYAYVDHLLISRAGVLQPDAIFFGRTSDYGGSLPPLMEWALFSVLLVVGLALLRGTGLQSQVLPWAAFPVGLAAVAALGALRPRGAVGIGLVVLLTILLVLFRMVTRERATLRCAIGLDGCAQNHLLLAVITLGVVSGAARRFRLYFVTPDSFDYLSGAYTLGLASGPLTADSLDTSYFIGQQAIHAAGYALGIGPLYAMGWALLACTAGMLAALVSDSWFADAVGDKPLSAFLIIGIAAGSPYVWRFAAYVNSHMLIAALVLVLLLVFAGPAQSPSSEFGLGLLLFSALVFTRGEAPLVIALMLLGFTASSVRSGASRAANLWLALAIPNFAWALVVASLNGWSTGVPRSVWMSVALGSASILGWLLARNTAIARRLGGLWVVPWVGLAAAHVVAQRVVPGGLSEPLRSLRDNMLNQGASSGVLPMLLLLFAVALAVGTPSRDTPHLSGLRTMVLGYLPAVVLARASAPTAWSAGGITEPRLDFIVRTGFGDSTNRVLFHLWFVLIAGFLISPRAIESARRVSRWSRIAIFGALLSVVAQQWTAQLLPWTHPYRWAGWALIVLFAGLFLQRSSQSRNRGQVGQLSEASDPAATRSSS